MRVFVESVLPCDADLAWEEVQHSALLVGVARPFVLIEPMPGEAFPIRWTAPTTHLCRCFLFGLIPLGTRTLTFARIDHDLREIHTRESDPLIRQWDHCIRIKPLGKSRCHYSDEIELDAGVLTPLVWLFTTGFYMHRQRRWRTVARRLQAQSKASGRGL